MNRGAIYSLGCALLIFQGVVHAQVVNSLNAIGALNVPLTANEPTLVAVQLIPSSASDSRFTIPQVLGTSAVPDGTTVSLYNSSGSNYTVETFSLGSWSPGTNRVFRGQSMWVTSPSNCLLQVVGYVPDAASATTEVAVVTGMQLMSYPYPVDNQYTNTSFAQGAPGDLIIPVDGDGSVSASATPVSWYSGVGWAPSDATFHIASGWWYRSYSNRTVTFTKPYDYP